MKRILLVILALCTAIFVGQSFIYSPVKSKRVKNVKAGFLAYPKQATFCGAVYMDADSDAVIPRLSGWGKYSWKITTRSDSAQFYFDQGINMYYSYHLIEAEASFDKASKFDPDCAMAWYGKALAMGPTINTKDGFEPSASVMQAVEKSRRLAQRGTTLEQDLIQAMQSRYHFDPKNAAQVAIDYKGYATAMESVSISHAQNADVLSLYADALMLKNDGDNYDLKSIPTVLTSTIQKTLEQVFSLNPAHPGANHYYIHTMEGSLHPEIALASAKLLDTLMPQVAHMTHMPSHIYSRTGDYSKGIRANEKAIQGFYSYLTAFAPVAAGQGVYEGHNLHVLTYCAQMAGNYKISHENSIALQKAIPDFVLQMDGSFGMYMQYAYAMPYFTNVRFGKWKEILADDKKDTLVFLSLMQHFARGMAFSHIHQPKLASKELSAVIAQSQHKSILAKANNSMIPVKTVSKVAQWILTGVIAEEKNQPLTAIKAFRKAVLTEDSISYTEPRNWLLPARQYLGNALLKAGRHQEAIAVFEQDLKDNKNNGWSLTGLSSAYQQAGNPTYKKLTERLKSAWDIRDVTITSAVF